MKNQSNRFLGGSGRVGGLVAKTRNRAALRRWLLRRFFDGKPGQGSHVCSTETDRAAAVEFPWGRRTENVRFRASERQFPQRERPFGRNACVNPTPEDPAAFQRLFRRVLRDNTAKPDGQRIRNRPLPERDGDSGRWLHHEASPRRQGGRNRWESPTNIAKRTPQ